jgi:hypothetical protein
MKTHLHTPAETLTRLNRRVPNVSADFAEKQVALQRKLHTAVRDASSEHSEPATEAEKSSSFGSAWLPGPLSYPWLLMFAGVPKVIEHLLRQC